MSKDGNFLILGYPRVPDPNRTRLKILLGFGMDLGFIF